MRSVLISGASIAGPALAYWLQRDGWDVVIVERTPALRGGGQPIDIRGVAVDVVAWMGLKTEVDARRTQILGFNALSPDGVEVERHTDRSLSAGRHDSGDLEIFRDDFSELLFEATTADVHYRFNDTITEIKDNGRMVSVSFESGEVRDFDLVIGADGIYSRVRRLVFGPNENFLQFLGSCVAIFTTENFLNLTDWQTAIGNESLGMFICPARANSELRIFMMFESAPLPADLTVAAQKALLAEKFEHFAWQVPHVLSLLKEAPDLYFGEIAQCIMPHWSKGRVALVGDAAYSPSPRSGQGTSLALVGAYVLASELSRHGSDYAAAFAGYERLMRPFVEANQALGRRSADAKSADDEVNRAKNAITLPPTLAVNHSFGFNSDGHASIPSGGRP
jgi:2-polyprenyl-6-methoxyphenol hydroxylase-like FAD-dependent oxidoreductase